MPGEVELHQLAQAAGHLEQRVAILRCHLLALHVVVAQAAREIEHAQLLETAQLADERGLDLFAARHVQRLESRQLREALMHVLLGQNRAAHAQVGEPRALQELRARQRRARGDLAHYEAVGEAADRLARVRVEDKAVKVERSVAGMCKGLDVAEGGLGALAVDAEQLELPPRSCKRAEGVAGQLIRKQRHAQRRARAQR